MKNQLKMDDYMTVKTTNLTKRPKEIEISSLNYPFLLKSIKKPPKRFYYIGNSQILNKPAVAIVGTRKPSKEGIITAKNIAKFYAEKGFNIVSGLAQGIDSITMKSALEFDGSIIGVLPSSLDNIVPKKNKSLADDIIDSNGILITEYQEGTTVQKYHYINRNRIISGLSMAVIIIESSAKSGTMHTIRFAKEQLRIILVADLPAEGNQILIKEKYPIIYHV